MTVATKTSDKTRQNILLSQLLPSIYKPPTSCVSLSISLWSCCWSWSDGSTWSTLCRRRFLLYTLPFSTSPLDHSLAFLPFTPPTSIPVFPAPGPDPPFDTTCSLGHQAFAAGAARCPLAPHLLPRLPPHSTPLMSSLRSFPPLPVRGVLLLSVQGRAGAGPCDRSCVRACLCLFVPVCILRY